MKHPKVHWFINRIRKGLTQITSVEPHKLWDAIDIPPSHCLRDPNCWKFRYEGMHIPTILYRQSSTISVSPNGTYLAYSRYSGGDFTVYVENLSVPSTSSFAGDRIVQFASNDCFIVSGDFHGTTKTIDPSDLSTYASISQYANDVAVSPDSSKVGIAYDGVFLYDLPNLNTVGSLTDNPYQVLTFIDNSTIAAIPYSNVVYYIDTDTMSVIDSVTITEAPSTGYVCRGMASSPDGNYLIITSPPNNLLIVVDNINKTYDVIDFTYINSSPSICKPRFISDTIYVFPTGDKVYGGIVGSSSLVMIYDVDDPNIDIQWVDYCSSIDTLGVAGIFMG